MDDETKRRVLAAIKKLIQAKRREPTLEEIAEATRVPVEEIKRELRVTRPRD